MITFMLTMADINKVSKNMEKFSQEVLSKLDKEINELKKSSIAADFDKRLTKKLSENLSE